MASLPCGLEAPLDRWAGLVRSFLSHSTETREREEALGHGLDGGQECWLQEEAEQLCGPHCYFWRARDDVQNCASNPGTQLLQSDIGFMIGSEEAVSGEELIDGVLLRVLLWSQGRGLTCHPSGLKSEKPAEEQNLMSSGGELITQGPGEERRGGHRKAQGQKSRHECWLANRQPASGLVVEDKGICVLLDVSGEPSKHSCHVEPGA